MSNVPDSPRLVTLAMLRARHPSWFVVLDARFGVWVAERREGTEIHVLVGVDLERLAAKLAAADPLAGVRCSVCGVREGVRLVWEHGRLRCDDQDACRERAEAEQ